MLRGILPTLFFLLAACGDKDDSASPVVDNDLDGYAVEEDCDDSDADVNPGMDELPYNGLDDDCDEATLDDDLDGDGFGIDQDCDDDDAAIHPDAEERCDGVDNDCDGVVDGGATDATTWHFDGDGDGYGDSGELVEACEQPSHHVANSEDCDDGHDSVHPDADELCDGIDNDCDDEIDEDDALDAPTWYADGDGDGWGDSDGSTVACEQPEGFVSDDGDCDDADDAIHPAADELCDSVDNDCDDEIDEDDAADATAWYADADGDGHGDAAVSELGCSQPTGFVSDNDDCDDADDAIHPAADELCDSIDNDCDGDVDEDDAVDASIWYADDDGDGYGDGGVSALACAQPTYFVSYDGDCDDNDDDIHPAADELCDTIDNDCDGDTDEDDAIDASSWYVDADGDGHGSDDDTVAACSQPSGYQAALTDCDDSDADVHPAADERCDSIDNDCDGDVDEDDAIDVVSWYADADGDGYGDAADAVEACAQPSGYEAADTDCDDTDADIHPAAVEACDEVDNDCDGDVDEGVTTTFYLDDDGDRFGDAAVTVEACVQPRGYVNNSADCDDSQATVRPTAVERCDAIDNDCDGDVDEDDAADASSWYADDDGDGYGDLGTSTVACSQPTGFVSDTDDCDDGDSTVNPAADELCDTIDNDCDGDVDEDDAVDASTWYADDDGDGHGDARSTTTACDQPVDFVSDDTDCRDSNAAVYPGADERCNGVDDDCDGDIDEDDAVDAPTWYVDSDGDGYGSDDDSTVACTQPSGYQDDDLDCDDSDVAINPDAVETFNSLDDDCNGAVDDVVEDCYNDTDDDRDGHADCEDSDCLVECTEDCSDGLDNDRDGYADCDDDECYGVDGCGWPYTLELTTDMSSFYWGYGDHFVSSFGSYSMAGLYGTVSVEATPYGWSGSSFSCSGSFTGYTQHAPTGGFSGGSDSGMDWTWDWEPTEANGGVSWDGSCALEGLPRASLGSSRSASGTLYRQDASGAWTAQYQASSVTAFDYIDHGFYGMFYYYLAFLSNASQTSTVTWTGSY